jgi:nitrite reductase (NADH) small subunit
MKTEIQTWTAITAAANIPPREGRAVSVAGKEVAIFNLNGRFLTIENSCPHKGGPLCDGIVTGTAVVCPLHGRHFDLETGIATRASEPLCVSTYPTRVENGIVHVDLQNVHNAFNESSVS